jgi:hypothetical protein
VAFKRPEYKRSIRGRNSFYLKTRQDLRTCVVRQYAVYCYTLLRFEQQVVMPRESPCPSAIIIQLRKRPRNCFYYTGMHNLVHHRNTSTPTELSEPINNLDGIVYQRGNTVVTWIGQTDWKTIYMHSHNQAVVHIYEDQPAFHRRQLIRLYARHASSHQDESYHR